MTRRNLLAVLGLLAGGFKLKAEPVKTKWYITGGMRATQSDCTVEPIICFGTDRLDALKHSGITVWSEEEWKASDPARFHAICNGGFSGTVK